MPAGRPTLYAPEYCEAIVDLGKQGKSIAQMASHFDVARTTLLQWADTHTEFMTALSRAKEHAQAWWEDQAVNNLTNREFQSPIWKKSMEARFREDYTERKQVEGTFSMLKDVDGVDIIPGGNGSPLD